MPGFHMVGNHGEWGKKWCAELCGDSSPGAEG